MIILSYYLKKTKLKNRTYLSIDESFYSHDKKGTAHRCFKSLGSVESNIEKGIEDPVSFFQKEVDELNRKNNEKGVRKITDVSPMLNVGYFPIKSVLNKLKVKKYIDMFKLTNNFNFDLYSVLSSLIFARVVNPCSKYRTFHDVLPKLYEKAEFSYDQLLSALSFLGTNYKKFVEIFTMSTSSIFGINTDDTYFDSTNFYFEIDKEDDFRRNGPSKENRHCPIVGLGLLLDKNQIPIGMSMFPGNQSEKPVLREVIDDLKRQNCITGRTIHVADKGLNCAENIAFSKKSSDGYIFSKSVKNLPEIEKTWVRLDQGFKNVYDSTGKLAYRYKSFIGDFPYTFEHEGKKITINLKEKRILTFNPDLAAKKKVEIKRSVDKAIKLSQSQAKRSEYGEKGKYINFVDSEGNKANVELNTKAIEKDIELAGYNLLVTSEIHMSDAEVYDTYHNLWRIEESFRIMKSDLDARPVYLQKRETIQGHFLICYLAVLLERLFQFKVLENKFHSNEIFEFMRDFKVTESDRKYINTTTDSELVRYLTEKTGLPLTNYFLSETQIKRILNYNL